MKRVKTNEQKKKTSGALDEEELVASLLIDHCKMYLGLNVFTEVTNTLFGKIHSGAVVKSH